MRQLYAFTPPGASVTLVRASDVARSSAEAPEALCTAAAVLGGFVQPLSAVLVVAGYPDDFPFVEDAVGLDGGVVQWCVTPWPPTVEPPVGRGGASAHRIEIASSQLPSVATLLASRPRLSAPPGYTAALYSYTATCTRVRVEPEEFGSPEVVAVRCHGEHRDIPVEVTADGSWVAGPIVDTDGVAPVAFDFFNLGFEFRLSISVGWSLDTVSESFHHTFRDMIAQLVAIGWSVVNSDGFDDIP